MLLLHVLTVLSGFNRSIQPVKTFRFASLLRSL